MELKLRGKIFNSLLLKITLLLVPLFAILIYKFLTKQIAIGDTNVYFYTAYKMLQGETLYRDIIFTNLPLFPIISVLYFLATGGDIYLFYFTGAIESFIVALLVFWAVYSETKRYFPALASSLLFAFSVNNLVMSSFQTGIYTASVFAVASYILIRKAKPLLSGIFISLCFLTKAYFIPVAGALALLSLMTFKKEKIIRWLLGLALGLLPLLPFILVSPSEMLHYLFGFSLTRATSINKLDEAVSFIYYDFLLLTPVFLVFRLDKSVKTFWIGLFSLFFLFFMLYSDFYYMYFGMIVPFLAIAFGIILAGFLPASRVYNTEILILIFLCGAISFNLLRQQDFAGSFKVAFVAAMEERIEEVHPQYLYGRDMALALSYLTKVPFPDSIVDTNPLLFASGYIDKKTITEKVVVKKSMVIVPGVEINGEIVSSIADIVDSDVFYKHCSLDSSYPAIGRPPATLLVFYLCPGEN